MSHGEKTSRRASSPAALTVNHRARSFAAIATLGALGVLFLDGAACGGGAPEVTREDDPITVASSDAGPRGDGAAASSCASFLGTAGAKSTWVGSDANGKLTYAPFDAEGDRIMDFSHAGYMGGGVALPSVAPVATVHPSGGDDSAAIQSAIDAVSKRALADGHRGAVLLAAGTFNVTRTLTIAASGVVLRGSGSGISGTTIQMTGAPHLFLSIRGSGTWTASGGTAITDAYVPSGSSSFHVANTSGLAVGDTVLVSRPVTAAWIQFMGMDTLVRNGETQTWLAAGSSIPTDRTIAAIAGDEITLDVPLSDSLDGRYIRPPGATIAKYTFPGRISQVGVESMRVVAPPLEVQIDAPTYTLIEMGGVIDSWVKDVVGQDQYPDTLKVGSTAKRITIVDTTLVHTVPVNAKAGYPVDFAILGTQVLLDRCGSKSEAYFPVATHARAVGPNVVLDFSSDGKSNLSPHQRWATGLLLDNVVMTGGGAIQLFDRGTSGTGHGWTMGWGVVWNSKADSLLIQRPPGATNWAIGSEGTRRASAEPGRAGGPILPSGTFDSAGVRVTPSSLYLAQLCERLGPQAIANIGAIH